MTSTEVVREEIRRFLRSKDPEVICITGEWGVGKTYIWCTELDATRKTHSVSLTRYSYASLFGINSLESLKLALFENLEFLREETSSGVWRQIQSARALLSKATHLREIASALPYIGQVLSKAGPLYFSAIRNQIICIDDLERRGRGLDVKDVFGLISFLREQRACKVVLLLNSDALAESKGEFDTYFEKVVDTRIVFKPTAAEAVQIALPEEDQISSLLRQDCEELDIANIRVIKKIERLADVPVDEYYRIIKSRKGEDMRSVILSGLEFRRINGATPEMAEVVRRTEAALKRIASESKLNAARIVRYGVVIDDK